MSDHSNGPAVSVGDVKSGWCNGCADRPPYEPNETTQIRSKSIVMSYCPKCTVKLLNLLAAHVSDRGLEPPYETIP